MPFPIDRGEIAKTEDTLGVRFPASHIGVMRRSNGGAVEAVDDVWQLVPFRNSTSAKMISRTASDIVSETQSHRERPGFPSKAVVVALNGTPECLCFLPREDDPGRLSETVYLWSPDSPDLASVVEDFAELVFL